MDTDTNHDLSGRLAEQAARLDLGTPMVEVVIQRGKQRQQRKRTAVGVLSVAGVCAAAIVSVNVLTRPADNRAATSPGEAIAANPSTGPAYTPARLVDSNLVWSQYEPDSAAAVSFLNGTAELTGDGPYLAWSTAPGLGGSARLWRSDDGLEWQPIDDVPVFSSASVVQHNGRFLAFGTAPAVTSTGAPASVQSIASSDDGGLTWRNETLPIGTSDLEDEPGVASVTFNASSIAAGPAGVLAVVRQSVTLDWETLLPADQRPYGFNPTPTGVDILGPSSCDGSAPVDTSAADGVVVETTIVIGPDGQPGTSGCTPSTVVTIPPGANTTVPVVAASTLTWAELGVSEKAAAAALQPTTPRLFFSADGDTFSEVASPVSAGVGNVDLRLTGTDDGFAASVVTWDNATGSSTNEVFHTTDGQTWTDLGPAPVASPDGFSALGDRLVMSGWAMDPSGSTNASTTVIAVRSPDGTWTATLLNDLVLPTDGAITSLSGGGVAVGPDGITIVGMLYVDPIAEMGGVETTRNGITMHADAQSSPRRFVDEDGADLTSLVTINSDTGGYDVRRTEDGDVVATFSEDDIYSQLPAQSGSFNTLVLHSADGVAWSRESLTDLVGQPVSGTGGIRVTDTQVIVAANLAGQKNADGTSKQVLLLGTPKG